MYAHSVAECGMCCGGEREGGAEGVNMGARVGDEHGSILILLIALRFGQAMPHVSSIPASVIGVSGLTLCAGCAGGLVPFNGHNTNSR